MKKKKTASILDQVWKLSARKELRPLYPKVVAELQVELDSGGEFVETPADQTVIASVKVIHESGLIGKYDWFELRAKDLKNQRNSGVARAIKRETLVPPLLIPLPFLKLEITGQAFNVQALGREISWMTFFRLIYVSDKGVEDVRYEQVYNSPVLGTRKILDVIGPQMI